MDFVNAFFPLLLMAPFYILPLWLLFASCSRDPKEIADKIEKIADNENAGA